MFRQQPKNRFLCLSLAVTPTGNTNETDIKTGAERFQIRMVGDHQGNLHRQFTALSAPEKIQKAVTLLAGKNRHLGQFV